MTTSSFKGEPDQDPFEVLGVSLEATDAEINKAYRRLALKLHPDKQQNVSDAQKAKLAKGFHDLQQAKAFLSDPEFESARAKYKAKLASQRLRRAADAARNRNLSIQRKRMRDELEMSETQARARSRASVQKSTHTDDTVVEDLRKESRNLREEFAERRYAEFSKKEKLARANVEERQVRLKWSRKKIGISPSDDSLTKLLARFGPVERVDMLGSKGNAALVTFADGASVAPCVQFYKTSEEMRASYVGKRKEQEENEPSRLDSDVIDARVTESVADWKLRREVEREKLLRRMENDADETTLSPSLSEKVLRADFPQQFPCDEYSGLDSFQKLEKAEEQLLAGLLSKDILSQLKMRQVDESNWESGERTS